MPFHGMKHKRNREESMSGLRHTKSIEALKATRRRALAAQGALFASLQQRAFTGAL